MGKEIERKWLMSGFPQNLKELKSANIEQGYLTFAPEVRVRMYSREDHTDYLMTIKSDGTLEREEIEFYINEKVYEDIQNLIGKPFVKKKYIKYELEDGHILECSLVDNDYFYAEVEFNSVEEAKSYELNLPEVIKDITYEDSFKMKNYWRRTRE